MPRADEQGVLDLEALERFVVENDDLLALEEAIGRFNIFDALRIERAEIRHSNFLAWLLAPNESHAQGDLFLKAFLMDLLRRTRAEGRTPPVSPVLLDGIELHDIEIRREWKNIDLLIVSREPAFVVAVENKVDAGEHSNQLNRYEEIVRAEFASMPALFVYLSAHAQETEDEDWLDYSYRELHGVLTRVRRTSAGSLGADVGTFLDHYLSLIGSRFMDDTTIQELCRRIYSNHRRAIDLIVENAGNPTTALMTEVAAEIKQSAKNWISRERANRLWLVPRVWLGTRVDAEGLTNEAAAPSLFVEIEMQPSCMKFRVVVGPHPDIPLRRAKIERITAKRDEFGFRVTRRNLTDTWTRVYADTIKSWRSDELPRVEDLVSIIRSSLDRVYDPMLTAVVAMDNVRPT